MNIFHKSDEYTEYFYHHLKETFTYFHYCQSLLCLSNLFLGHVQLLFVNTQYSGGKDNTPVVLQHLLNEHFWVVEFEMLSFQSSSYKTLISTWHMPGLMFFPLHEEGIIFFCHQF